MNGKIRSKILVVDDNATNLRLIQDILKDYYQVYATLSGEKALDFLEKMPPDIILLDIEMPRLNGYEMIKIIKKNPKLKGVPVIFLTGKDGVENEEKAFKLGAVDYILKPISSRIILSRIGLHLELENYRKNLENMVEEKTDKLKKTQDAILDILTSVTAFRDNETGGHIMRTTLYVKLLVDYLVSIDHPHYRISTTYAEHIVKCAKLHDIGKVAVSDTILLKSGRLTQSEYQMMKAHTIYGNEMIENAMHDLGDDSSFLHTAKEIVLYHHERWDGKGYPTMIKGNEIPLSARIMAIADVYDALSSTRPYKPAYTHKKSLEIIYGEEGHFDPTLLNLCKGVFAQFEYVVNNFNDEKYPVYSAETLRYMFRQLTERDLVESIKMVQ